MKRPYIQRTVRFDPQQFAQLEELASQHSRSMADVLRLAIAQYIAGEKRLADSKRRHLRVTEYMQVALDAIIRENHPQLRETLVLETDRRMKLHHGA